MKRVLYTQGMIQEEKWLIVKEYEGFCIYERITASGIPVSQEYLFTDGKKSVITYSFNNLTEDEVLDAIDNYKESGKFGFRGFNRNGVFVIHPNGDNRI